MATAIIPKSEIRRNENITVGYGEVPFVVKENGEKGWGLPAGGFTSNVFEARRFAEKLDIEIRKRMKDVNQLLTAA